MQATCHAAESHKAKLEPHGVCGLARSHKLRLWNLSQPIVKILLDSLYLGVR